MTDTFLDIEQARKRSVTADDVIKATEGAFTVLMGPVGLLSAIPGIAQHGQFSLPPIGTLSRDRLLAMTPYFETMWSAVIFKLISKKVAQGFRIEDNDDSARRIKQAQSLILSYDGAYPVGLQRGLRDYLTTNMGMVLEKARSSNARGSKITGLFHLDALRCYPTLDPAHPLVYWSYYGGYHLLNAEDVIRIVDMPSPRVELRGYGQCAADRAWSAILRMAAIQVYFLEKITGTRNLAIHIVNGITDVQLQNALNTSGDAQEQRGFVLYKGSTIIPMLKNEAPTVVTIPLAEIPDGFNVEDERKNGRREYAFCAGANVDEFVERPAGLNSGLSALVADEAASGQGMAAFDKQFELAISHTVLAGSTTFYMGNGEDWRDAKAKADAQKARADMLKVYVDAGSISPLQMLNVAVDEGDLPAEYLPQDATEAGVIADNEKLARGEPQTVAPVVTPLPSNVPQQQQSGMGTKEVPSIIQRLIEPNEASVKALRDLGIEVSSEKATGDVDALIDDELAAALVWAKQARGDG